MWQVTALEVPLRWRRRPYIDQTSGATGRGRAYFLWRPRNGPTFARRMSPECRCDMIGCQPQTLRSGQGRARSCANDPLHLHESNR